MRDEFVKKLIEILQKNLKSSNSDNLIDDLFDNRLEEFHKVVIQNKEYKEHIKEINKINNEIKEKFNNDLEIIKEIEKYNDESCKLESLFEKLMYKFGVLDGLLLITQGTKTININEFFKENNFIE